MGMLFKPMYTLEPSLCLYGLCGTDSSITTLGYGFWIPETDFNKMKLKDIVLPYYLNQGPLRERIQNIEYYYWFRQEYLQS